MRFQSRIGFLGVAFLTAISSLPSRSFAQAQGVALHWLEKAPPVTEGVSWGVPWPRGTVKADQKFALQSADGKKFPLQSWPLAYWPDGSMKWIGFASVGGADTPADLQLVPATGAATDSVLKVTDGADAVEVDTGVVKARFLKQGANLVDSLTIDGRQVATHGQLECILQDGPDSDALAAPARHLFISQVKKVTVEQTGPVRAVVKIEGMHHLQGGDREWLPFVVRFYMYAGQTAMRMVHTIVFDGDQDKDFIRGLGLSFDIPMREQPQNRHVRFSNSNGGLWAEPVMLGGGRGGRGGGGGGNQLNGDRVPNQQNLNEAAQWDSFRLDQLSAEGFTIIKRTNPKSSWVAAAQGERASGLVFAGDVGGGLGIGLKGFWQSFPATLQVDGATTDTAKMHVWVWSPQAAAMDMRHYDIRGHGNVNTGGSYEDYEPGFATPTGIARTSDLMLYPSGNVPGRAETAAQAAAASAPPLLVTTPQYLHSTGAFGVWSLQDRSTPFKKDVEDRLDGAIDYYAKAIDQHHWYGYWNFGDVRHAYDPARHEWRYDVGGYAWDNSELGSVLWLWYSYVRTGRADIFRMAEAMSRHNSEVDTYHLGEFSGLGSRHNVSHWGDSAKEARISQATHNRFYYYLTTDERVGDVLHEVAKVDAVASKLDPMRKAQPITEAEKKYPGRIRVGPDWLAFVGNWMTEWERTGDNTWRDKIMAGVNSMYAMPYWMRTGRNLVMGYDPVTSKLFQVNDEPGRYNLPTIQGGAEVAFEVSDLLASPEFDKMWQQYCRLGTANADVLTRDKQSGAEGADAGMVGEQGGANSQGAPRLSAYVYLKTKNAAFAQKAIRTLTGGRGGLGYYTAKKIEGVEVLNPVDEAPNVSTNETAQSSLMAIEILEMCADQLPKAAPAQLNEGAGGQ